MPVRLIIGALLVLLVILQARLWLTEDGYREVIRLSNKIEQQAEENKKLRDRNRRLEAEVKDLKSGFTALEERARADLGMIGEGESFYVFGSTEPAEED
ncbi:MAG: cell division protein FtsB [Gammaproteobacteria bacterium]